MDVSFLSKIADILIFMAWNSLDLKTLNKVV